MKTALKDEEDFRAVGMVMTWIFAARFDHATAHGHVGIGHELVVHEPRELAPVEFDDAGLIARNQSGHGGVHELVKCWAVAIQNQGRTGRVESQLCFR